MKENVDIMELEKINSVISGSVAYTNKQYVDTKNNFMLPKIICSIATNLGDSGFDINSEINAYGYKNIKILKSARYKPLTEEAKNLFGLMIHESILNKSYVIDLNLFNVMECLGWKNTTVSYHKNQCISMLSDLLVDLKSFSLSCKIKNIYFGAGLLLGWKIDPDNNNMNIIIDPTFFEIHNNDLYHISGDIKKINKPKSPVANTIYLVLLSNNYNSFGYCEILYSDLLYTVQLGCVKPKNAKTTIKRALDKLVASENLVSYKFIKKNNVEYLSFKLNRVDIGGDKKQKEVLTIEHEQVKAPATAPQVAVEVENFDDYEPVPARKEVDVSAVSTAIPYDLFDDDSFPF